jgi:hypothetical protein
MNKAKLIALAASCMLAVTACKTKKALTNQPMPEVTIPSSSELLIQKIGQHANSFGYYSAEGSANYKDAKTDQNLDLNVVMEKDKYLWIRVTALFGIEAARIRFTTDSIVILDRIHRKCIIAGYPYIKKMTGADMQLSQVQQVFAGNAVFDPIPLLSIADTVLANIVITTVNGSQKQTSYYNPSLKLTKNVLEDKAVNRQFSVEYPNFYLHNDNAFPSEMNINIRAEKNIECKLRLNNFAFEKKKEVQFSIPANYEVIRP